MILALNHVDSFLVSFDSVAWQFLLQISSQALFICTDELRSQDSVAMVVVHVAVRRVNVVRKDFTCA